jgi:hypothetical protein
MGSEDWQCGGKIARELNKTIDFSFFFYFPFAGYENGESVLYT